MTTVDVAANVHVASGGPPASDQLPVFWLSNGDASVFGYSVCWSPSDHQLVAASLVAQSNQAMKAILATLALNGSATLSLRLPNDETVTLDNTRRGFITLGASLGKVNATGEMRVILHPATHDPQTNSYPYFYIVSTDTVWGDAFAARFVERLNKAIIWPVVLDWAEYLLYAGYDTGLVESLPCVGPDFTAAIRVLKNEQAWKNVISAGIAGGHISLN